MHILLTTLACCLTLCCFVQAAELPLNGERSAVSGRGEAAPVDSRVHLGLNSSEEGAGIPLMTPGPDRWTETSLVGSEMTSAPATGLSAAWNGDAPQTLELDTRPQPHRAAFSTDVLPSGTAGGPGVPDSWVYMGLGVLLLGLGWACSGWVSRPATSRPAQSWGEVPSSRSRRVKMVALNVSR